ncbi:hypothetical protein P154DRAFT_423424, partial [Amniculicola lignicola CBS 123094]
IATKKVLSNYTILNLKEQVYRFKIILVYLIKGSDLAIYQANDISEWISKLINTLIRIQ